VTQRGAPVELAGIAIGLTLVAIHLLGININGTSVNPARSTDRLSSDMRKTRMPSSSSGCSSWRR